MLQPQCMQDTSFVSLSSCYFSSFLITIGAPRSWTRSFQHSEESLWFDSLHSNLQTRAFDRPPPTLQTTWLRASWICKLHLKAGHTLCPYTLSSTICSQILCTSLLSPALLTYSLIDLVCFNRSLRRMRLTAKLRSVTTLLSWDTPKQLD